jgi:hypothetical protein
MWCGACSTARAVLRWDRKRESRCSIVPVFPFGNPRSAEPGSRTLLIPGKAGSHARRGDFEPVEKPKVGADPSRLRIVVLADVRSWERENSHFLVHY